MSRPRPASLRLDAFLPYRLSVAANVVSQRVARVYAEQHGLSTQEWRLMAVLGEDGERTQLELVKRTRMEKVPVSRAAHALEARGLVRRAPSESDARSRRLSLTAAGRRIYDRVAPAALKAEAEVLAGLDDRERALLRSLLERVEQAASEALTRDP
ncbi:MarR family transcriptional regulator [Corallococcus praedator]|uniref:MarR family transcriptional regulator n=1 Tax=Corallococcus praedator TaxID=2316724 RepID=A0ABX9QS09_9BACT|nr:MULTISPECIES: MarR family transcriptional regulator [Corallococcus]RKH21164.1 MarR family transcriptional regulator [Corallococcus sp. CA047B]RKH35903.1 MarR family transcriptional regulator [Corallococcus sp. CA031C]RKI17633.1 MarR family transcriptional regulator [Corallococcus praedator]